MMTSILDPLNRNSAPSDQTVAAGGMPPALPGISSTTEQSRENETPGSARIPKIALEEHFMLTDMLGYFKDTKVNIKAELYDKAIPILTDFGDRRLSTMDQNGIDFSVLSLSGPGVQVEKDAKVAVRMAKFCNDALALEVSKRPNRYGGFAHLAMQDPEGAADELERCVRELGFKGALINGQTLGVYLDDRRYDVFWERVVDLTVPIYLHPGNPIDHPAMYADHPEMWGPTYSWAVETCAHAMRLIFSGLFDRFPTAKIILGHMGETLPIQLWRLDSRLPISNQNCKLLLNPSDYLKNNVLITTSGVCSDSALRCAIDSMGVNNVMFSVDYPFEDTRTAASWIDAAPLTLEERQKICYLTASTLMNIKLNTL